MELVISSFLAVFLAVFVHELGRWLVARVFGEKLSFSIGWGVIGEIPVPRGMWSMPNIDSWKQRVIAAAGFVSEIGLGVILWDMGAKPLVHVYIGFALIHLILYEFYAGNDSDIKWILGTRKEL